MSFISKGLAVSLVRLLSVPITLITGVIVSRRLGPSGVGQMELFRTTSVLGATIFALGIGNANIYFINNQRTDVNQIVSNSVKIALLLGALLALSLFASVSLFPGYFGEIPQVISILFCIGAATHVMNVMLRQVLVAQLDTRRMVTVDLVQPLFLLSGAAILALSHTLTPATAIALLAMSYWAVGVCLLILLRSHLQLNAPFDFGLLRQLVSYGIKLAAVNLLFLFCSQVTILLLPKLRPDALDEVGWYTRATAIAGLTTLVPLAIGPLLYAKWSSVSDEERRNQAELASRLNCLYSLTAVAILVLAGRQVLYVLYDVEFLPAYPALVILGPALAMTALTNISTNLLAGSGRAGANAVIFAGSATVVGIASLLLIPPFGFKGAALAVLAGNLFTLIAGTVVCRRIFGLRITKLFVPLPADLVYVRNALIPTARSTLAKLRKKTSP